MKVEKRKWEIFWEIPDCPPFLTSEPARMFTNGIREYCGADFQDCILEYRDNTNFWYLDTDEWSKLDKVLFDRIIKDPEWSKNINTISEKYCYPYLSFINELKKVYFSDLSDEKLYGTYSDFMKNYIPAHASGHPANVLEMKNQRLSGYLKTYLLNRLLDVERKQNVDELFSILTEPVKDMSAQKEAQSFFELAVEIVNSQEITSLFKDKDSGTLGKLLKERFPKIWQKIINHHENFCWTPYNWEGPANDINYYIETISSVVRSGEDVKQELEKIKSRGEEASLEQKRLVRDLNIDSKHELLLKIASDIMLLKSIRKDCMYKGAWASEKMYEEIGKRLGLTTHEARFIFYFEMKDAILSKKINTDLIKSRVKEVVLHQRAGKPDIVLHGDEAYSFVEFLSVKRPDYKVKEIKGQIAYPGKVIGTVKYVNTPEMMNKMENGDILVAYATQPNLLPAMKKASAFVTDFGGITCHAAIVAREWKIPCIIGTKIATKVLKDGDEVEVNADKGIVRIIKKKNG
jgi:phosphoenolpyruvate synthase/pyruvate phosphate dikinase